jgi:hypothetical protein
MSLFIRHLYGERHVSQFSSGSGLLFITLPPLANAELIKFLCSINDRVPGSLVVDSQTKTVMAEVDGFIGRTVLKIADNAIWLIKDISEFGNESVQVTVIGRSPGDPTEGASVKTFDLDKGGSDHAIPSGTCWERKE